MRRVSDENGGTYVVKTVRKLGNEDAKESEAPISYGFMRSVRKLFLPEDKIVFIFPAVVPLHWQEEENIVLRTERAVSEIGMVSHPFRVMVAQTKKKRNRMAGMEGLQCGKSRRSRR